MINEAHKKFLNNLLDTFTNLPNNWDSYGGIATSPKAVNKAKELLEILPDYYWQVVPSPDGGVQIEMAEQGYDIEILIYAVDKN